jgi:3-keto-5-aminohexanoate cleavage enzyme
MESLLTKKVIITAAITGSRPTKQMNPAVPYTPEEIADSAVACWKAGAAIAHIHVRNPDTGEPSSDFALYKEVVDRIRSRCDLLLNLTTSGLFLQDDDHYERRLQVLELTPEICSLDIGSMNFQDRIFANPPEWSELAAKRMLEHGVKPEIEVFEVGHVRQAMDLIERGLIADPPFFQLCMGTRWGIDASEESLQFLQSKLPPGTIWSVLGIGQHQRTMIELAVELGGHIRVGFEDNLYLSKGVLAQSNAQFVEHAVDVVQEQNREVASVEEARSILGI